MDATHIAWAKRHLDGGAASLADSAVASPDLAALGLPCEARFDPGAEHVPEALGEAIAARWGAPGGRVLVTAGASEANAVALGALLAPGDEVLVEAPGYEPHRLAPARFGARVRTFRRTPGAVPGTLADAVAAALGPATRAVVVTHLHNPSGVPLDDADVVALERLAERHDLVLLADETFRDADPAQPLAVLAARGPRWITTGSLTKAYGLGALKIGWLATEPGLLARCAAVHDTLSAVPSLLGAALALALMPHLDTLRARTHAILAANRAAWEALCARQPVLRTPGASRGTTTWMVPGDGPANDADAGDAFAAFAADRHGVLLVPGRYFGDPSGVRVTLGAEPGAFARSLVLLERAAAEWPARPAGAAAARKARETEVP